MLSGRLANPAAAQLPLDGHDTDPTPIARPSRGRRPRPGRARTRHLRLPGRLLPPFRYPRASASRSRPPRPSDHVASRASPPGRRIPARP